MVHSTHSMDERSFQRLLRRTVALPVALLVLLAIVLVVEILSLTSSLRQVDSTLEVISNARSLLRYMVDMESSIRGYYLTGKSEYLQPFVADKSAVSRELAVLRQLTADNPVQAHRIEELDELDRRWIAFADRSLAESPQDRAAEFEQGKQLMDRIHVLHTEVLDTEYAIGVTSERRATLLNRVVLATAVGLSLLIAVLLFTFTRRELRILSSTFEKHLQAEEEKSRQLAESRERFQITLNSLGDAVIATDAEGNVRYINPVAQELTGWSNYIEARGRPLREVAHFIDERTGATLTDPIETVRREEKVVRLSDHVRLVSQSGHEYPIEMTQSPIINDEGLGHFMRVPVARLADEPYVVGKPDHLLLATHRFDRVGQRGAGPLIDEMGHFAQGTAARLDVIAPACQFLGDRVDVANVAFSVGGDDRIPEAVQGNLEALAALGELPALFFFCLKVLFEGGRQDAQLAAREGKQQDGDEQGESDRGRQYHAIQEGGAALAGDPDCIFSVEYLGVEDVNPVHELLALFELRRAVLRRFGERAVGKRNPTAVQLIQFFNTVFLDGVVSSELAQA